MATRREPLAASRDLERVRRRLRIVLDAGQRRHVADVRFYQLLSEADASGPVERIPDRDAERGRRVEAR